MAVVNIPHLQNKGKGYNPSKKPNFLVRKLYPPGHPGKGELANNTTLTRVDLTLTIQYHN